MPNCNQGTSKLFFGGATLVFVLKVKWWNTDDFAPINQLMYYYASKKLLYITDTVRTSKKQKKSIIPFITFNYITIVVKNTMMT